MVVSALVAAIMADVQGVVIAFAVMYACLWLDSLGEYALKVRRYRRAMTAPLRACLLFWAVYLVLLRSSEWAYNGQTMRQVCAYLQIALLIREHVCDALWLYYLFEGYRLVVVHKFPGSVYVCRRETRMGKAASNSHKIDRTVSGAMSSKNVGQVVLIAYIQGLFVELVHANANDFAYERERSKVSGRKPRIVQIPIFSTDQPDCNEVMRNVQFEIDHGYDPYEADKL